MASAAVQAERSLEAVRRSLAAPRRSTLVWPAGPRRAHSLDLVEVDADIIIGVVSFHCHVYGRLVDARRLG